MASVNPLICSLCGLENKCALEVAKATGTRVEPCWCVQAVFTPELLAKVPQASQGMSCICASCASVASNLSA